MNPQKKPKSRQEILKKQQQSTFVGREEHITAFRYNLVLPPVDWCFLFNVWGQGGVGKSTLLRQFRRLAEESGFLTAYTSDADSNVLEVMGRVTEQLEQQEHRLDWFAERYKVYLQKKQELEADPDAPQGFSVFLGKSIAKASLGLAKQVPGSGAITPFLDEEAIANQAGDWASYVAKRIGNKDEVQLVQKPIEVLTPLFLQDLSKVTEQKNLLLLFDTYERTEGFLDSWLREILEGSYGDLPANIILVIAGREELERNRWADYQGVISRISLETFTEEEARQYLDRKGITNPRVIDVILRLSGRLPLLIATLAAESPSDPTQIGDPSGTAVERFLQWVDDPKRRQVALDAALPRFLNRDVIATLHGEESADELFNWLKQMPFVEECPSGWAYHDIARTQMLRHKRLASPQSWVALHTQLADYYNRLQQALSLPEDQLKKDAKWQEYTLSSLYHHLCKTPQQYLGVALNMFLCAYSYSRPFALSQAEILCQAGKDTEIGTVQNWGERLLRCFDRMFMGQDKNNTVVSIFTDILKHPDLDVKWRSLALFERGGAYRLLHRNEEALKDLNEALILSPNHAPSLATRGTVFLHLERYEEALQDLNIAIDLDPQNGWALVRRGWTYNSLQQYDKALEDYDRALNLNAQDAWALASRGETYCLLKRYDDALIAYNQALKAIESIEGHEWILRDRGTVLCLLGRYEEALEDFNRVIESNPKFVFWFLLKRGKVYLYLGDYQLALSDFNQAINLNPQKDWFFYTRALAYLALNQADHAKTDLDRAIHLAQQNYNDNPDAHRNTLNLAIYYLVANKLEQAKHFYSHALHRGASQARIQEAVHDLEDLLKVFPSHQAAQQIREALMKRIRNSQ
ncbi:tetratricopeptide repeat protein [Cyanobacteria bacterium FACHB-502]|nr:tetratricopeptide repeat protein [Cyanobacteria bacterium FACHB-502]